MEELLARLRACGGMVCRQRAYSERTNKWTESDRLIDRYTGLDKRQPDKWKPENNTTHKHTKKKTNRCRNRKKNNFHRDSGKDKEAI